MRREVKYKIKGMNKDSSFSAFNPEFSFENRNIRITTLEGNTTLSIVNEKGTKPLKLTEDSAIIFGLPLGYAVIDNLMILFTTGDGDNIYQISIVDNDYILCKELYSGTLNFQTDHPIETLAIYENENNIKVYWVDGINQPRVINIKDVENLTDTSFDFVPTIRHLGKENINITKNYSSGSFPAGVIQYCFTYFNDNRQETNIVGVSPLYYTSDINRGGSPEETLSNSFSINLYNLDTNFNKVRLYSILRTSLDSTPLCKVVADLDMNEDGDIFIIDTGNLGYTIDPTQLLYVGGEVISANTISQKDNTLFLGNISINKLIVNDIKIPEMQDSSLENIIKQEADYNLFFKDTYPESSLQINNGSEGSYPYINQLNKSSRDIKIFKRHETYRCGLQFQHKTGKWSSPVFLKDIKNNIKPTGFYDTPDSITVKTGKPVFDFTGENALYIINALIANDYQAVRPVIVYPTDNDRDCICQGVINPTVFNIRDRESGTTFSQASWFFRPKLPYEADRTNPLDFEDFNAESQDTYSENSVGGIVATKDYYDIIHTGGIGTTTIYPKDAWAEFRHNYFIPDNRDTRAEIQVIEHLPRAKVASYSSPDSSSIDKYTLEASPYLEGRTYDDFPEMYVIDSALVTLNSPEIDNNSISESLLANTKLRYVGIIPITGNTQDIDIMTSTPGYSSNTGEVAPGFSKIIYNKPNISVLGGRRKLADAMWVDYMENNKSAFTTSFITYPWHRKGSLNVQRTTDEGYRSADLKAQKRSNLFFSTNSIYLNDNNILSYSPKKPEIVRENDSINYIQYPLESDYDNIIYKGNVDSVVLPKFLDEVDGVSGGNITADSVGKSAIVKARGYYINFLVYEEAFKPSRDHRYTNLSEERYGIDPTPIKYKSSPHIVVDHGFHQDLDGFIEGRFISPNIKKKDGNALNSEYYSTIIPTFFGSKNDYSTPIDVHEDILEGSYNKTLTDYYTPRYSWLWLAELYREIPDSIKFGGNSKQAIENNQWVVAGDTQVLDSIKGNIIIWSEGDHYYQRYDCLKTYPYTLEDTNSVVEILSFMCETRVNLDGRYDSNRGKENNLVMTPNNFNLMNSVYNQGNNFFNYRAILDQYAEIDDYINQITWSKTKTFGEIVDTWTNITLASVLDLDGDKGRVEAIKRLNNELIVFQERGISQILYNDNIQISTENGVPIEVANSGKVQGKRYLSSYVGCNNKWSICESPAGLYFIDGNTKGIYLFNGNLTNLSDKLGFSSWAKDNLKENNFISYYDPIESEILFLNNKECLTYSERLGSFTSFYDYTSDTIPINMGNRTLLVGDPLGESELKFYEYHAGKYNDFYGTEDNPIYKPFSISLVVNPEPTKDKIFNTVEFRADVFDVEGQYLERIKPFSNIQVKNEYQDTGDILLDDINLRKKFRIWRHTIQRDKDYTRDRIRNPWTTITLKNEDPEDNKVILHDVVISYFD